MSSWQRQPAFPAGRALACTAAASLRRPLERELGQGRAALLTTGTTFSLRETQLHYHISRKDSCTLLSELMVPQCCEIDRYEKGERFGSSSYKCLNIENKFRAGGFVYLFQRFCIDRQRLKQLLCLSISSVDAHSLNTVNQTALCVNESSRLTTVQLRAAFGFWTSSHDLLHVLAAHRRSQTGLFLRLSLHWTVEQ